MLYDRRGLAVRPCRSLFLQHTAGSAVLAGRSERRHRRQLEADRDRDGGPDYGFSPPGDIQRLFVVEQNGLLRIIQNGVLAAGPRSTCRAACSRRSIPANANDERGFLGWRFIPASTTRQARVFARSTRTPASRFRPARRPPIQRPNNATQNYKIVINEWKECGRIANVVDPASRREIISFGKNAGNHNGGTIAFGPDGYLYLATRRRRQRQRRRRQPHRAGRQRAESDHAAGQDAADRSAHPVADAGQHATPSAPTASIAFRDQSVRRRGPGAGDLCASASAIRIGSRSTALNGDLILADVGQNNIEEINRVTLGGNYGWAVKEGDVLFNRTTGTIGHRRGNRSPGMPGGLIDPISGPLGTLQYDHGDGISITGGFVYRGTAIPELFGKYVFGDLAIRNAAAARRRPAVLRRPGDRARSTSSCCRSSPTTCCRTG